jgi:hypothetical protein
VLSKVSLNIYSVLGQQLMILVDERQGAGHKNATFDSSTLSSGVYFYRLYAQPLDGKAGTYSDIKKMLLVR